MAKKTQTIVTIIDDLDGSVVEDGSAETVLFSLDGTAYEIDLNAKNAAKLRDSFAQYTAAGRKVGGSARRSGGAGRSGSRKDLAEIRAWAKDNGHDVNERGRIAASIVDAYDAAH